MARDDPSLLIVPGGVTSKLQYFSSEILHDGGEINGGLRHQLSRRSCPS